MATAMLLSAVFTVNAQESLSADVFTETEISRILSHGPWPIEIPRDPGNELSNLAWAEQLGLRLFNLKTLSGDQSMSCATCHQSQFGFSDNLPLAMGVATHSRNTQGLLNIGLQRWFGWDGGADSLWSAAIRPMLSPIEMNGEIPVIASRLREDKYFMDTIDEEVLDDNNQTSASQMTDEALFVLASKSIAAYTRTLVSPETPFDSFRNALASGDISAVRRYPKAAKRGLKLFLGDANCQVCHFGANFSNGEFHDTGRPFFSSVGKVDPGRYTGIKRMRTDRYNLSGEFNGTFVSKEIVKTTSVKLGQINWGQWRTPSLRNLTLTAPYMHDGSLGTLREVVDAYADIDPDRLHTDGESILKPLPFSDSERNDLVEFLRTLSP